MFISNYMWLPLWPLFLWRRSWPSLCWRLRLNCQTPLWSYAFSNGFMQICVRYWKKKVYCNYKLLGLKCNEIPLLTTSVKLSLIKSLVTLQITFRLLKKNIYTKLMSSKMLPNTIQLSHDQLHCSHCRKGFIDQNVKALPNAISSGPWRPLHIEKIFSCWRSAWRAYVATRTLALREI